MSIFDLKSIKTFTYIYNRVHASDMYKMYGQSCKNNFAQSNLLGQSVATFVTIDVIRECFFRDMGNANVLILYTE